jgi:hypothetical protein
VRMLLCIVTAIAAASGTAARETQRVDISGTWSVLVDAGSTQNTPTFVFKQQGERLSGTWTRGDKRADVSGTVKGDKAVFWVEGMRDGRSFRATYRGTIESPTKMSGAVDVTGALSGSTTWTATKK